MRLVPFLSAILVMVFFYFIVVEREALFEFAGVNSGSSAEEADVSSAAAETETSEAPAEPEKAVPVIARKSIAQTIDSAVIVRGETQAARQVELRSETGGQVVSEPLRKGTFVEQDEIMCEIDKGTREVSLADANARLAEAKSRIPETEARIPEAIARIQEATSRLLEAEINRNQAEKLFEDGFATESRVVSAIAAVKSAEAAISSAEAGLKAAKAGMDNISASIQSAEAGVASAIREIEKLTLRAPFKGLLESDTAELGSLMQQGTLCGTIIQLDPIKIVGFVPEADVNRITEGVRAGAQMIDGQRVFGTVEFLSRSADQTTRTFLVEIGVPNPDLKIRDGQTADILIESDGASAHLLPQSALTLSDGGDLGVRTIVDGKAKFSKVAILRDSSKGVWVSGLPNEVEVILVGQEYTSDGTPVLASYEELSK
ncbi:MAG: efflux RND transporter periplasmic adaptor subunit [Paracoccaceae bacterium]|nr:efflux RND transporter periplasmic adaptor subunit [Paracoccaceae bacterium]MDG2257130.1 efflux RND transporter periplasmic adaptor subunit [Paracoccaceae bacterium]